MADDAAGRFPAGAIGSLLGAASTPADVEAAVVSSLKLEPRERIRDRAIVDLTVGCIAADLLLDAAMPPGGEDTDDGTAAADPPLSPELSDAVSRYLGVTLLSQWELHRVVVGGAGGALLRDELDESKAVDSPRRPPPLSDATRA
ncbi:hypothetical protein FNF29_00272 [Cafeteria roenbergensis]|uniref:Uncharacterized protein n=1 Tax=Cafeteria roenbergensis TaxID=33653 RepID=A0A5A8CY37_CAFRO|nr:hypothetical protein FNF29_00272 [Cafeteria roenbergensis]|eukprot:KAA0157698.1 hypothetical protein FNF29_00272 [Cafeteria roenbergensis]